MDMITRTAARRILIEMALRRQRAGSGSSKAFLTKRTAKMNWPDLTSVLSPIRWAVTGAVATRLYMPERVTEYLDIVIDVADASEARQKLASAGFVYRGELSIGGSAWTSPDGISIDVIEGREEWWKEALTEAQTNRDAQGLPVLPLRYLVLMKMQAGRVQDIADATRMLGQASEETLTAVRALFSKYAQEDTADLESVITLGKLEMQIQ